MTRALAFDLEFDKVLELVATQARTGLGRRVLTSGATLPSIEEAERAARRTRAAERMLADDGALSVAGLDEAARWLQPDTPPPTEPRELLTLLVLAQRIAAARRRLLAGAEDLEDLAAALPDTSQLIARVAPRLGRDGSIPDQASAELARLRRQSARLRQELLHQLEGIRRGHPDVTTDAPPTVRRDRYCLPVRSGARSQLPGLVLDSSGTGATAFVEPFEVVELNNQLAETAAAERDEVRRILAEIAAAFAEVAVQLATAVDVLAELDAVQARAQFGHLTAGRVLVPGVSPELVILGARHPLLDERLHTLRVQVFGDDEQRSPDRRVVPLDFRLPDGVRTLVVSGPNAGGKTVVLKTLGLMVLMAYHGIPLPVDEGTAIPRIDHIWCHIGDEQNVAADLSSFSGTMAATVRLLAAAGKRSLVLYDELGAGTDPLEGAALGVALLEELAARRCLTVVTTHLAAIGLAAGAADGMANAAMGYDEILDRPTYTFTLGRPGRSRALEIAARTGIESTILERARELLGGQHLEIERWLQRLETLENDLLQQRDILAAKQTALDRMARETLLERQRVDEQGQSLVRELAAERERLRVNAKRRLDEALARLDRAIEEHDRLGRRQRQRLRDEALAIQVASAGDEALPTVAVEPGTSVRLATLGGIGVLEELRGSRARVTVDGKRLWVAAEEVVPIAATAVAEPRATVRISGDDAAPSELMLIGMDSERARDALESFLDHAVVAGRSTVRIVHGHGTGVLRRMVTDVCRSHPAVRSYRHPPQHLGGTGVTEVALDDAG